MRVLLILPELRLEETPPLGIEVIFLPLQMLQGLLLHSIDILPRQIILAAPLTHSLNELDKVTLQRVELVVVAEMVALVKAVD